LADAAALLVAVEEFRDGQICGWLLAFAEIPDESAMKVADECFYFCAEAGNFAVDQFDEALFLAVVLAEDAHFVRLRDFGEFLDRLLGFGLESLEGAGGEAEMR